MTERSRRLPSALIVVLILLLGIGVFLGLVGTRPAPRVTEPDERPAAVEVMAAEVATVDVEVTARGTVLPAEQAALTPEVSGRVVWVHPRLLPGGRVEQGEELFRIEPRDFELALQEQRAAVERAQVELDIERGRGEVAEREVELMDGEERTLSPLVRREPQRRAAEVALQAAESGLERAQLALERTRVRAPFNAVVRSVDIERGQLAGPQAGSVVLVGTDAVWVQASLPVEDLARIRFDEGNEAGSAVRIRQDVGVRTLEWSGTVLRFLGDLEPAGRMARILIRVEDPFKSNAVHGLPLLIGSYVNARIEAGSLTNVVEIPRRALREGNRIHIMDADGRLDIRHVDVVWRQPDSVLVAEGIRSGEWIVTSNIPTPVEGMLLRAVNHDDQQGQGNE